MAIPTPARVPLASIDAYTATVTYEILAAVCGRNADIVRPNLCKKHLCKLRAEGECPGLAEGRCGRFKPAAATVPIMEARLDNETKSLANLLARRKTEGEQLLAESRRIRKLRIEQQTSYRTPAY